jgi:small nuclear ribonucleoprotein (snRNP)-like protein
VADPNYQKLATIVPVKKPPKTKSTDSAPASPREPQLFEALADTYLDGPFTLLRRCFLARARVCVVVRRVNSVRGTLHGYLKAFDKHMNMVLLDVQQQWIPPHQYAAQDRAKRHARDTGSRVPDEEVPLLSVADARRNRSFTTTSYAKQLFVRGDNVVMVLHDKTTNTTASTASFASKRRDYAPVARR